MVAAVGDASTGPLSPLRRMNVVAVASLLASAIVLLGPQASAATINVDCNGQDLQNKINSASAGSTLLISGTCIGNY